MHRCRRRRFRRRPPLAPIGWPSLQQYAISELRRNSGAQFHPEVVDAFEQALNKTGAPLGCPTCQRRGDGPPSRRRTGADPPWLAGAHVPCPSCPGCMSSSSRVWVSTRHTCGQRPDDAVGCSDCVGVPRLDGRVAASLRNRFTVGLAVPPPSLVLGSRRGGLAGAIAVYGWGWPSSGPSMLAGHADLTHPGPGRCRPCGMCWCIGPASGPVCRAELEWADLFRCGSPHRMDRGRGLRPLAASGGQA